MRDVFFGIGLKPGGKVPYLKGKDGNSFIKRWKRLELLKGWDQREPIRPGIRDNSHPQMWNSYLDWIFITVAMLAYTNYIVKYPGMSRFSKVFAGKILKKEQAVLPLQQIERR